jgi:hypothetical protein
MEPEFLQWPLENNSAALAFACDPEQWCEGQAGKARRTSYRHASGVPAPEALLPYCWDSLGLSRGEVGKQQQDLQGTSTTRSNHLFQRAL